jgi:hypothetical protein
MCDAELYISASHPSYHNSIIAAAIIPIADAEASQGANLHSIIVHRVQGKGSNH